MRRSLALALLAALLVPAAAAQTAPPDFVKAFSPAVIGPGSSSQLVFTIENGPGASVGSLAFTDTLPAGVAIASAPGAATTCGGDRDGTPATVSAPAGGTTISFSGGSVLPGQTCTVSVFVTSTTPGVHMNVSGDLTSSAGNSGTASADLEVTTTLPGFTKTFSPPSIALGGRSTLTFTIDNSANGSVVPNLDFIDTLPASVVVAGPANASTTCGTATIPPTVTATPGSGTITLDADGTFAFPAVGASTVCTVTVDVTAPAGGTFTNTAALLAEGVDAGLAVAQLTAIRSTLELTKSFVDDPVAPGGTVQLAFRLRNRSRDGAATDIAFTDDLTAMGIDITATSIASNTCSATLALPDGDSIDFSDGTLAPGAECTFAVDLAVGSGVPTGEYTNTTSGVTGTIDGDTAVGLEATDVLFVAPVPTFSKAFTDDPVGPGGTVTLEFTIGNTSATSGATDIAFVDPLGFLPVPPPGDGGAAAAGTVPAPGFCGPGSSIFFTGNTFDPLALNLSGASLAAGASCTFSVTIDIPAGQPGGTFTNTTEPISATVDGETVTGGRATDDLVVVSAPTLAKSYPTSPFAPGATAPLEFELAFDAFATADATGIGFTDDLDAALPGLVATGLPVSVCGGTLSSSAGGSLLTFTGGELDPGEVCTFTVSTTIPAGAAARRYTNTTSAVTATVDGVAVTSPPAETDFAVAALTLTKAFTDGPASPGGTVTLEFTITNAGADDATAIAFEDFLEEMIPGASASGLPFAACGGTVDEYDAPPPGNPSVRFRFGEVPANDACSFSVTVSIPAGTAPGDYVNRTTRPTAIVAGSETSFRRARATLTVLDEAPPVFTKAFAPNRIAAGGTSVLTFTIDNSLSPAAASALDFPDTFPSGVVVASPANASTTCTGGTLIATPGAGSVSYTGGSVAAQASCTVSVSVTAAEAGVYDNVSGALSSSAGTSDPARARLVVGNLELTATKTDALDDLDGDTAADAGETISYAVAIDYTSGRPSASLTFADTPGAGTALVPGSVTTTKGTVTTGNGPSDTEVVIALGTFSSPGSVAIAFDVVAAPADGQTEVCNQGAVTFSGGSVLTDDPDTALLADPTCGAADDNDPPVADAGPDALYECVGPTGASVVLDGSGSTDPDGDLLTYTWTGPFPEGGGTVTGETPTVTLPVGVHVITLEVEDPSGETDTDTVEITVDDTAGPVLTVSAPPLTLWPPDHTYREISLGNLGVSVADACDSNVSVGDVVIQTVSSDEVENGIGDGNTLNDIAFLRTCDSVFLRAERQENGDGRVYTVTLAVADGGGNVSTADYLVSVPKTQGRAAVAGPPVYTVAGCDPAAPVDASTLDAMQGPTAEDRGAPTELALAAVYPNPFARATTVAYDVPEATPVRIAVYDALGREVAVLVDRTVDAGALTAAFDATALPSGTYLVRMTTPTGFAATRAITVLR